MINSDAFSYINVLDKAADNSYRRQTMIANNIANADTPSYKRKDLDFQSVLEKELRETAYTDIDMAVKHVNLSSLDAKEYTDYPYYSYRIDRNNVDIDTENVELASEQLRYQAVTSSANQLFQHLKTAIGS